MLKANIHITPQNFPHSSDAVQKLVSAMDAEAILYCEKNNLPEAAAANVFVGLCTTMSLALNIQKQRVEALLEDKITHAEFLMNEDGTSTPLPPNHPTGEPPINLN